MALHDAIAVGAVGSSGRSCGGVLVGARVTAGAVAYLKVYLGCFGVLCDVGLFVDLVFVSVLRHCAQYVFV